MDQLNKPPQIDPFDDPTLTEVSADEQKPEIPPDPSFQSELEYEGYADIEDSDNNSYSLNVDGKADTAKELIFEFREESPDSVEENLVDPQGNNQ